MVEHEVTVINRAGIHARPSALLVQTTKDFKCDIFIEKAHPPGAGDNRINAKSIMGIITLGASYGTKLKIITNGEDEKEALEAIIKLFERKFEEE